MFKSYKKYLQAYRLPITLVVCALIAGYWVAELEPHARMMQHNNPLLYRALDLFIGYGLSISVVGFIYGCCCLIRMRREINKRASSERHAIELAAHDELTELPNRRCLQDTFPSLTRRTVSKNTRAVMMLDVDGFKPVNDVYGHAVGDELLKAFAARLVKTLGPEHFVARLGGDEFAIITKELSDKADAATVAQTIITAIQQPFELGTRSIRISTGIGIALFPDDGYSSAELLRRADIALYRAKAAGRALYRFFEVEMDAAILHRTLLEQKLRKAISTETIQPHFQPILDLKTQKIKGFEALARWTDEEFGVVTPSQFIPLAEETGMISDLTNYLLKQACSIAARWPDNLFLSFNISPVQIQENSFPLRLIQILNETRLEPHRLLLEITETALLKQPITVRHILEQISATGVKIALDDFGVGHSSLSYLRDFPITKVKIDKSFTLRILENQESKAIIDAILVLARGLSIDAVAEGIETTDILDCLNSNGCSEGQGFLFSAAVSASEVPKLLREELHQTYKSA